MNYRTIDFFIEKDAPKNFLKAFEGISRIHKIYVQYLDEDFTKYYADDKKGVEPIQKTNCPVCKTIQKAFIRSEAYSEDLSRRILSASCIRCNTHFYAFQEGCSDYQLN